MFKIFYDTPCKHLKAESECKAPMHRDTCLWRSKSSPRAKIAKRASCTTRPGRASEYITKEQADRLRGSGGGNNKVSIYEGRQVEDGAGGMRYVYNPYMAAVPSTSAVVVSSTTPPARYQNVVRDDIATLIASQLEAKDQARFARVSRRENIERKKHVEACERKMEHGVLCFSPTAARPTGGECGEWCRGYEQQAKHDTKDGALCTLDSTPKRFKAWCDANDPVNTYMKVLRSLPSSAAVGIIFDRWLVVPELDLFGRGVKVSYRKRRESGSIAPSSEIITEVELSTLDKNSENFQEVLRVIEEFKKRPIKEIGQGDSKFASYTWNLKSTSKGDMDFLDKLLRVVMKFDPRLKTSLREFNARFKVGPINTNRWALGN